MVNTNKNGNNGLDSIAHMLPGTDCACDPRYVLGTRITCTNDDRHNIQHPVPAYIDDFMKKAYGGTFLFSEGGDRLS